MGLEYANIAILIGIVGLMLFFLRRLDRMETGIRSDMEKMETGIRADMKDMEAGIRADMEKMELGMEKMETGIRSDMEKMEAGIRSDMKDMESGIRSDMKDMESRIIADVNLKHGEVREDLRDIRVGLVEVRERQARLEGIVEGMGRVAEPVASAD